jgi:protein TonB
MQPIKTGYLTPNKRLGILLLFSVAVHSLVFISNNNDITKLPAQLPNQSGRVFSITLQKIQPPASNKSPAQKQKTATQHKSAIKPQQEQLAKADKNTATTNEPVAEEAPVQSRNAPDTTQVISIINLQLRQYFYYPRIAQKYNWQGQVILKFKINHNGKVENINIVESSGYKILDLAAVNALNKLNQIASNFNWPNNGMDINLPVIYRLNKG